MILLVLTLSLNHFSYLFRRICPQSSEKWRSWFAQCFTFLIRLIRREKFEGFQIKVFLLLLIIYSLFWIFWPLNDEIFWFHFNVFLHSFNSFSHFSHAAFPLFLPKFEPRLKLRWHLWRPNNTQLSRTITKRRIRKNRVYSYLNTLIHLIVILFKLYRMPWVWTIKWL